MAFKVVVELKDFEIEKLADMETYGQTYEDIIGALIRYASKHNLQLSAAGVLTCGDICLKAVVTTASRWCGFALEDDRGKPVHLDKCTVNVDGIASTPSQSVLDGLYPPSEFEQVATYVCRQLYLWQIEEARSLQVEVIGAIGQDVWVALKRRVRVIK